MFKLSSNCFRLPNLRKLTLDCIQGDQEIELHRVLNVEGIDELTIIQPVSFFRSFLVGCESQLVMQLGRSIDGLRNEVRRFLGVLNLYILVYVST